MTRAWMRVGLLGLVSVAVVAPTFAGLGLLSPRERDMLRVPDRASQAAIAKVNAARDILDRASREDADHKSRRQIEHAARQLAKAERALADGDYRGAYIFARRVEALGLESAEEQR